MTAFEIEEFTAPSSLDEVPGGATFREMTALRNTVEAGVFGSRDLAYEPDELLPHWLDQHTFRYALLVRVDGRVVARGLAEWAVETTDDVAWINIEVLAEHRGRGIGSALLERLAAFAVGAGKRTHQGYAIHPPREGAVIDAPTGFGSVPAEDPAVRFLLHRGFTLGQVERASRLTLPPDRELLDRLYAEALARAGEDYRLHTWEGSTPEEWVEAIAVASTGMNTDAPSGGLDVLEDVWTAQRVRDEDAELEKSPRRRLTAAVEHTPTGALAGFTELSVPPQTDRAVSQEDTIVLKAHRGHRLGMLLKLANLRFLEQAAPGHPSVTTFNAEENRHMLDVNEAIGFAPVAYGGGWRRVAPA